MRLAVSLLLLAFVLLAAVAVAAGNGLLAAIVLALDFGFLCYFVAFARNRTKLIDADVDAADAEYEADKTRDFLVTLGASHVEELEE